MKLEIPKGTTSKRITIKVQDSTSTIGAGLTGLTNSSSGLVWAYRREDAGNAGGTSVTLASATLGTFTSGGFKETDSTKHPGHYEIGVPDAVLATGASWAVMTLKGVTSMVPVDIEIQLTDSLARNRGISGFTFAMHNSDGTNATGLTVSAHRSIDGASEASCTNSVSELANGLYKIDLSASDLNGTSIAFRFSASAVEDAVFNIVTQG